MDWLHALILGLLQGLTEFLPISSSAHLILVPIVTHWPDQGLDFDIAVHVGTLTAVLAYFRHTLWRLITETLLGLRTGHLRGEGWLGVMIVAATVPIVLAGGAFEALAGDDALRGPLVIAAANLVFAVALWAAARYCRGTGDEQAIRLPAALAIGLAQCLAIIPGTSRSGVTMTAGLMVGLAPTAAARFSFLLSIPTIAIAGAWKGLDLLTTATPVDWGAIAIGTGVSAVAAYACIAAFLALLDRIGMTPFVIYRLLLGAVLLFVFW
ncbi:Undecaprenyl-diphosphatase [wastewater metagenome]|uniref:Undecaprenyl-diphosphatase n=2 Tax=unclassified sequences TaxID=12908 RepID=A0A5B8RDY3_9ZZZZ|nr:MULTISPECIES: undecaprenyl-diphosphate phosphatase [Arhodomonas]MCS4505273.1 undecaprenyl-diphosphate phosphatase [Arhodomonas aquaeolei]QEA05015.1 undecaprenyl-diphosphatase [uncultured organism]